MTALTALLDPNLRMPVFVASSITLLGSAITRQRWYHAYLQVDLARHPGSVEYLDSRANDGYKYAQHLLWDHPETTIVVQTTSTRTSILPSTSTQDPTPTHPADLPMLEYSALLAMALMVITSTIGVSTVYARVPTTALQFGRCQHLTLPSNTSSEGTAKTPEESEQRMCPAVMTFNTLTLLQQVCLPSVPQRQRKFLLPSLRP